MLTELMDDKAYVPMKAKELAILLNIPKSQREDLMEVLDALVAEGRIGVSKKGKYGKAETFSVNGIFSGHPKGFGFVTVEGMEQDVFIPEDKTGAALHGDRVQIVVEPDSRMSGSRSGMGSGGRRAEGAVIRVLEHANEEVVGYYQKNKNFGFVIPDNQKLAKDIFIPQGCDMGAVTGHKVVVKITDFGSEKHKPEGRVTEIIGHVNDPGTDILSIVRAYGLPEAFPQEVMEEIEDIPDHVTVPGQPVEMGSLYGISNLVSPDGWGGELSGRLDLRGLQTVTIDGEDAKDLDDAVTICRDGQGHYILGVHIADVSHYVKEGSPLDREARKRSTSVYLVDRVIPMLPHKLSNGICSLNAGTDRLALSCIMEVDAQGTVLDHRIAGTVIHVDRRMTYTAVNAVVTDRDEAVMAEYEEFVPMFDCMKELADILRENRRKRGAIDFDFPESKIVLNEQGKPLEIKPYERNAATRIIEDFMLLANETVAEDYYWQSIPFLFRSHDNPDPEKMKQLGTFINNFGYFIKMQHGEIHPKELQKLLDKIEGTPEEALLSRLTLRSMKQAKYTTLCSGHFGLATRYYTHFTSPIRRYPDLQIHRIIKETLKGGLSDKRAAHYEKILPEVAVQTSALERRADEAERETDKLKKCEYMSRFIGQDFDGAISGVTNWGLYVELPNTVEGLVRMSDLDDDYYIFDEQHYELIGEMTKKTYKLGQPVRVTVSSTDRLLRTVDFILAKDWEKHPVEEKGE
ncbi:ribonuclease R [Enterocloster aldenensis]|uniref:Ribonuclease R n=1 Tax=Enterocloster aldenensis TaxID=358742 RepID=A0AAW5C813_9FIRM|nr:ribonuclease R [uncultured Lachnoclostridium sp.]MBS5628191.1 ribonuclease R [Clostridiales bacterium]MCB7336762.1 ribonuclease R [Enterocloster aldenensis]MCC3394751.1 ribonuclease R [Clostridiales bacterium AHG0011]RGC56219.1 ribonuclease R [Dorea longicatena]MBS6854194.1 ribonuclease R [Clostridiales bacterium]